MYANAPLDSGMAQVLRDISQATQYRPYKPCGACRTGSILGALRNRGLIALRGSKEVISVTQQPGPGWDLTPQGWEMLRKLR